MFEKPSSPSSTNYQTNRPSHPEVYLWDILLILLRTPPYKSCYQLSRNKTFPMSFSDGLRLGLVSGFGEKGRVFKRLALAYKLQQHYCPLTVPRCLCPMTVRLSEFLLSVPPSVFPSVPWLVSQTVPESVPRLGLPWVPQTLHALKLPSESLPGPGQSRWRQR